MTTKQCSCGKGFYAAGARCLCNSDLVCSSHGTCTWVEETQNLLCTCDPGYWTTTEPLIGQITFGQCDWLKLRDYCASSRPTCFPGIEELGKGYDITNGDFKVSVATLTFQGAKTKAGNTIYQYPREAQIQEVHESITRESVSIFKSTTSFQSYRASQLGVSGSVRIAALEANAASTIQLAQKLDSEMVRLERKRERPLYGLNLEVVTLDPKMQHAIANLSETYEAREYRAFIGVYGTHYVQQMVLGGLIHQETYLDACWLQRTRTDMVETAAKAKFDATIMGAGSKMNAALSVHHTDESEVVAMSSTMVDASTVIKGGDHELAGQEEAWMQSVEKKPWVISFTLKPIEDLLASRAIRDNYARAIQDYYTKNAREEKAIIIDDLQCNGCKQAEVSSTIRVSRVSQVLWFFLSTLGFYTP
eukprot:gnl/TRDRNA2_/TRDRNA2_87955_c0_seq1.p1 gnl/TRDRNA2_/TRDRNA2_87955_c0~~gnl/TRDRNA2_/TRDRNA2_87955_c0_seq1.p1  ORF type:complete len:488 (+),score=61.58 gnl/TRDRNA2_/TRDRNA2_87955_c0_seq1:210-1466(+)